MTNPGGLRYKVMVAVLGDLGRSPRMLNHALALADNGVEVALAGYRGSPVDLSVAKHPLIRLHYLKDLGRAPDGSSRLYFLAFAALKVMALHWELFWLLAVRGGRCRAVLVQNPPSVPTLALGLLCARLRRARFVVDWHNFGYSMLALRLGEGHRIVRLARVYERVFGRMADAHLCVSRAMGERLRSEFGLQEVGVLHDLPRRFAPPVPVAAKCADAVRILASEGIDAPHGRAVFVCPTSWTADENMAMLLEACRMLNASPYSPPMLVLITGRGPQRENLDRQISETVWAAVDVRTLFLSPEGYLALLGAAHAGICMHTSSSGVDLPMKVIDLFGARTPVCAYDYGACLREQIEPGRNGLLFSTSQELADQLRALATDCASETGLAARLQRNLLESSGEGRDAETWSEAWRRIAGPVICPNTRKS